MFPFRRRKNVENIHRAFHIAVEDWLQTPRNTDFDAIVLQEEQNWSEPGSNNGSHVQRVEASSSPAPSPSLEIKIAVPSKVEPHLILSLPQTAFEVEPYRVFGHLIKQLHAEAGLCVLAISSPSSGDGKTSTAINLASILAQEHNVRVLLVEGELRRPSIAKYLGIKHSTRCLTEGLLQPDIPLAELAQHFDSFYFDILLAGQSPTTPYDLLKLPRFGSLLEEARKRYDYVIVDTPPLLPFSDCRLIEKWIDGLLVVVAAHKTSRKLLVDALEVVDPAKLVGLVLNRDDDQAVRYDQAYRYYA